jgi:hypothetical protein
MLLGSLCFHSAAGLFIYLTGKQLGGKITGVACMLLYYACPHSSLWVVTGMESPLNALAIAGFLLFFTRMLLHDRTKPLPIAWVLWTGLWGGLAVWARTDNVVLIATAALPLLALRKCSFTLIRNALITFGIPVLFLVAWLTFCYAVSGEWIQGSARMKHVFRTMELEGASSWEVLLYSADIFWAYCSKSFFKVPMFKYALLGLTVGATQIKYDRNTNVILAYLLSIPVIYGILYAGSVTHTATRYFVPPVICLTLASGLMCRPIWTTTTQRRYARLLFPIISVLICIEGIGYLGTKLYRGRNKSQGAMLAMAEYLHDETPPETRIAAWNSGIYGFYSDRCVLNLDGLVNNEIYHQIQNHIPHWEVWLKHDVEYIVDYERFFQGIPTTHRTKQLQLIRTEPFGSDRHVQLYRITELSPNG